MVFLEPEIKHLPIEQFNCKNNTLRVRYIYI